jgi:hypothetical protein
MGGAYLRVGGTACYWIFGTMDGSRKTGTEGRSRDKDSVLEMLVLYISRHLLVTCTIDTNSNDLAWQEAR